MLRSGWTGSATRIMSLLRHLRICWKPVEVTLFWHVSAVQLVAYGVYTFNKIPEKHLRT